MNRDRFETVAKEWNFNPVIIEMFRVFAEQYRDNVELNKTMNLLDVGGGTGLIAFDLAQDVNSVTIVDNSPAMVETARNHLEEQGVSNVNILEEDILAADLVPASYDGIYGHMSLHHIEDIPAAFDQFTTALKPGGTLVIGDLVTEDGSFHGDEPVPHNGFDTEWLKSLLKDRGFSSVTTMPLQSVSFPNKDREYDRFLLLAVR